jgi:uncharacterized membrane protein YphA (DoxX/SURF4 family)
MNGAPIRWAAAALVVFCLGTAFGVHLAAGDFNNMIHFYKNLVMAGGFLYVTLYGEHRRPSPQTNIRCRLLVPERTGCWLGLMSC